VRDWSSEALCARFPDVNFVPDPFLLEDSLPAKMVCVHCTVRTECLTASVSQLGVWGGLDELERLTTVRPTKIARCDGRRRHRSIDTALGEVCISCGNVA
jgi:hypothetical protein